MINRRTFALGSLSISALGLAQQRPPAANSPFAPRTAINGLTTASPVVSKYAAAVNLLKQLPASDLRNWTSLASVHNNFCPHQNWWFLPWHRAYLRYFELACQDVLSDPTFRLPYWDWTLSPRIPGPFLDPQSTLWDDSRYNRGNVELGTEVVGPAIIRQIVGASNWTDVFSGATGSDKQREEVAQGLLESTPHNGVHQTIGGNMALMMSPLDPIFWVHHCNIDRIWVSWARLTGAAPPSDTLWSGHKLADFYDPVSRTRQSPAVQSTLDTGSWGAIYDRYEMAPGRRPLLSSSIRQSLSASTGSAKLMGGVQKFSMDAAERSSVAGIADFASEVSPDFRSILDRTAKPDLNGQAESVVSLVIRGVQPPSIPSVAFRVFLNCRNPGFNTPIDDPSYVGTLAFFGESHQAAVVTYSIDVSAPLQRLTLAGLYSRQTPLDVALVPIDLRNPGKPPAEAVIHPEKVTLVGLRQG